MTDFAKFGKEKNFIECPELLDIHVPRMCEANKRVLTYLKDSDLIHSGVVVFEDFLGPDKARLIAEQAHKSVIKDGKCPASILHNLEGTHVHENCRPIWLAIKPFFHKRVYAEIHNRFWWLGYIQHLYNCPDDYDEQKVFHTDTFYPSIKFWYFPEAVREEDGPFWFCERSVELTDKLIDWHKARIEDIREKRVEDWRGPRHLEGSLRISTLELKDLGYEPRPVCVEADTLVIANTFGFHRRGDVASPKHRVSIHGSIRVFNPFG